MGFSINETRVGTFVQLQLNRQFMKIVTDITNFSVHHPVVMVGTFDGVHLGHQKLIHRLQDLAKKKDGESVIFTFYPHPRLVLGKKNDPVQLITTLEEKKRILSNLGIDHLVVYPFTKKLSQLSYVDFVEQILIKKLGMKYLLVGYDHRFGHEREGQYEDLKKLSKAFHFEIEQQSVLRINSINISSTKIRKAISQGNIEKANAYLGYAFFVNGQVIHGKKIGRKIGFPTANFICREHHKLIPQSGVYAILASVNGKQYRGMCNIGVRPTVNSNSRKTSMEAHLFEFNQDIYGNDICIWFLQKIRNEKSFNSIEELRCQLEKDRDLIRKLQLP